MKLTLWVAYHLRTVLGWRYYSVLTSSTLDAHTTQTSPAPEAPRRLVPQYANRVLPLHALSCVCWLIALWVSKLTTLPNPNCSLVFLLLERGRLRVRFPHIR